MQTTPIHLGRRLAISTAVLVAGLVFCGCSHSRNPRSPGTPPTARKAKSSPDPFNGKATSVEEERRAEAHARFAAGLVADLGDDDKTALEHYEKAIRSDASQDGLVLDVARREQLLGHVERQDVTTP